MKNIFIILAVVVVVGVGYFAFVNKTPQVAQQTSTPTPTKIVQATKTPTSTPRSSVAADWKTYTNTEFGFQLTVTDDWAGYYVKRNTPQRSDLPSGAYFDSEFQKVKNNVWLSFNIKDNGKDYSVFVINVYPRAYWSTVANDEYFKARYLGENGLFVFSKDTAQEPPQNQNLFPLISQVPQILSTFKFTK